MAIDFHLGAAHASLREPSGLGALGLRGGLAPQGKNAMWEPLYRLRDHMGCSKWLLQPAARPQR